MDHLQIAVFLAVSGWLAAVFGIAFFAIQCHWDGDREAFLQKQLEEAKEQKTALEHRLYKMGRECHYAEEDASRLRRKISELAKYADESRGRNITRELMNGIGK